MAELQKENDDLRLLIVRLSKIILKNVVEQREFLEIYSSGALTPGPHCSPPARGIALLHSPWS
jgi:hypothetical protein